jgi:glucosylceramidase
MHRHRIVSIKDWNMVLDLSGGPTYIDNFVDSRIIVNTTGDKFYKHRLGHFFKFCENWRIDARSDVADVTFVAFQRPDDGVSVLILNRNEEIVPVAVVDNLRGTVGGQIKLEQK